MAVPAHIETGLTPPVATPIEVGHHYIDTVAKAAYLSVGTGSVADWICVGAISGGSRITSTGAYLLNETTGLYHQQRLRNNQDGAPDPFIDDTGVAVASLVGPIVPSPTYVLNETTGLYHLLRLRNNQDGQPDPFIDDVGVP